MSVLTLKNWLFILDLLTLWTDRLATSLGLCSVPYAIFCSFFHVLVSIPHCNITKFSWFADRLLVCTICMQLITMAVSIYCQPKINVIYCVSNYKYCFIVMINKLILNLSINFLIKLIPTQCSKVGNCLISPLALVVLTISRPLCRR